LAHQHIHLRGECLPSVTEIIGSKPKPWLDRWYEKWGWKAEAKTRAASKVGNEFHALAEHLANGCPVNPTTRRLDGMVKSLLPFFANNCLVPEIQEFHVWSLKHKYQGTLDLIGILNGTLVVLDWKTSSGIYPEMALQLAAYAAAYFEMTGIRIKVGYIVHVSKKKPHHLLTVKAFELKPSLMRKFLKLRREFIPEPCSGHEIVEIDPTCL
jgi:hypothetical protein